MFIRISFVLIFAFIFADSNAQKNYLGWSCKEIKDKLKVELGLTIEEGHTDYGSYYISCISGEITYIYYFDSVCVCDLYTIAKYYDNLTADMKYLNENFEKVNDSSWISYSRDYKNLVFLKRKKDFYKLNIYQKKY